MHRPLRLTLDRAALQHNWRWLAETAGSVCGAAIKADGYGIGAREAMAALREAGCRDFYVSNWAEATELGQVPVGASLAVLHGVAAMLRRPAGLGRSAGNQQYRAGRRKDIASGRRAP